MTFRWSKTVSAYNKWAYIFDRDLPCEISTKQSALTVVTYIRDVIEFAHLNNVKGSDWYKAVSVTAKESNLIEIKPKTKRSRLSTRITEQQYIARSVFDLIALQQENKLSVGMKFYSAEDFDDLAETMEAMGVTLRQCIELTEQNIIEVTSTDSSENMTLVDSEPISIADLLREETDTQ